MVFTSGTQSAGHLPPHLQRPGQGGTSSTRSVTVPGRHDARVRQRPRGALRRSRRGRSPRGPSSSRPTRTALVTARSSRSSTTGTLGDAFPVVPVPRSPRASPAAARPGRSPSTASSSRVDAAPRHPLQPDPERGDRAGPATVTVRLYEAGNRTPADRRAGRRPWPPREEAALHRLRRPRPRERREAEGPHERPLRRHGRVGRRPRLGRRHDHRQQDRRHEATHRCSRREGHSGAGGTIGFLKAPGLVAPAGEVESLVR